MIQAAQVPHQPEEKAQLFQGEVGLGKVVAALLGVGGFDQACQDVEGYTMDAVPQ